MRALGCLTLVALSGLLLACGEGDFDQRQRANVEELRAGAFDFLTTNPGNGNGEIFGDISNGGPVTFARMTAHRVALDGSVDFDPNNALGDSASSGFQGNFTITIREDYSGPIILSAKANVLSGQAASYPSPASAKTQPRRDFEGDDEMLGYVLDYSFITDAVVVSPLSTLVVERAQFLGGVSSGNLALASRQIGHFFGLFQARFESPDNLIDESFRDVETLDQDLAIIAISQIARVAGVSDAKVWHAMRLDIRDDGELNGSSGLIEGSETALPNLMAADTLGAVYLDAYLDPNNEENRLGLNRDNRATNQLLDEALTRLDLVRSTGDAAILLEELVVLRPIINLRAGQMTSLGVRGFERLESDQESLFSMVFSSDGPSVAVTTYTSNDLGVSVFPQDGYVAVPVGALVGSETQVQVRVRPDGNHIGGGFDETVTLTIRVIE